MFHLDGAICAGHLNLPACVLSGNPQGQKLAAVRWTSDEKWRSDAQLPCQRDAEEENLRGKYNTARPACLSQPDKNCFKYFAICGPKKSQRKMAVTDGSRGTSAWLTRGEVRAIASDWLEDVFKNCPNRRQFLEALSFLPQNWNAWAATDTEILVFKENKRLHLQIRQIFSGSAALSRQSPAQ